MMESIDDSTKNHTSVWTGLHRGESPFVRHVTHHLVLELEVRTMDLDGVEELSAFVRDGKLVAMPRRHTKRMILLDRLAQAFEPGRHYTEAEVNEVLVAVFPDYVTLRRSLVDEGLLDREAGQYWRSGGSVD